MHSETITIVILAFSLAVASVWLVVGHLLKISGKASLHWAFANAFIGIGLSLWIITKDTQNVFLSNLFLLGAFCMVRRGIQVFMSARCTDQEQGFIVFHSLVVFYALHRGMVTPLTSAAFSFAAGWTLIRCAIEAWQCMEKEFTFKVVIIPLAPIFFLGISFAVHSALTAMGLASGFGNMGLTSTDHLILRSFLIAVLISAFIFNVSFAFIVVSRLVLKLQHLSTKDHLTGLYNRRFIQTCITHHLEVLKKKNIVFSLVMIDLDYFKKINDNFGHDKGDMVLKNVSVVFTGAVGDKGCVGRLGSKEFCVILPNCSTETACAIAEEVRLCTEDEIMSSPDGPFNVTISMGVATCTDSQEGWSGLVKRADIALYTAKITGRNRFHLADASCTPAVEIMTRPLRAFDCEILAMNKPSQCNSAVHDDHYQVSL